MSKRFPFLRAFRCAAIAMLLASALEGVRHIAVPGLSSWQSHTAAILFCASVVFILTFRLSFRQGASQSKALYLSSPSHSDLSKEEANLRAQEQLKLQSAALEAADNAIFIADHEGTIVWVNGAFTTMTGYTKEEVLDRKS